MILHITNFQGGGRTGGEVNWVFPKFLLPIGFNNDLPHILGIRWTTHSLSISFHFFLLILKVV